MRVVWICGLDKHRLSRLYFSDFSAVLVSIDKRNQTIERMFHRFCKHFEFRQKYSGARRIFSSPLGVWKCDETLSLVLDILHLVFLVQICKYGM